MNVTFEITLHNVPKKIQDDARFQRDLQRSGQKLLSDYQLDNDLVGTSINTYISDVETEDKEVFITCAKTAHDTSFNEDELQLMNEFAGMLAELVEKYEKPTRKGKQ